jgi:tetratricopeptide (TPR) repeat protein
MVHPRTLIVEVLRDAGTVTKGTLGLDAEQIGARIRSLIQTRVGENRAADVIAGNFAEAWFNLGDLLDERGRSEAAIEYLRQALRVAPNYADAAFNLALLLQRKNQYAEAADYWRQYLSSDCQTEWSTRAR